MRITIINGQNHKGATWHIGDLLVKALGEHHEVTEFFLPKDMPHFCIGCANCIMKGESYCPHYAEMKPIVEAIDRAELLIFTTPTYAYHASGAMKALLDHLSWRWMTHRPQVSAFKKQAIVISTSAGSTTKYAIKDIADSLKFWGIGRIYRFGLATNALSWDVIDPKKMKKINEKIAKLVKQIEASKEHVKPTLFQKSFFSLMRAMQKNPWNLIDAAWWKENGWMEKARPWK